MADLRRLLLGRIGLIFLVTFVALIAINSISLSFSPCAEPQIEQPANEGISSTNQRHGCPKSQGIVSAGIILIGQGLARITDWTPEAWTAACTAILALATLGLAIATRYQVRLARDEFAATHRPRLRIRSAQLTYIEVDQVPQGRLTIVNVGDSAATITELFADIACRIGRAFGEGRPNLRNPQGIVRKVLNRGEHAEFFIISSDRIFPQDYQRHKFGQESGTCIVGKVTYADANGVIRATGFFRSYDRAREYCVRDNEPDYEYED
jgi:hypothetical protein